MHLILHQCEPHHPNDHLKTVPRVYVKVSCMLFAWILTQCFVLLCHLRRPLWHTPPLQPSQVPSAPKPPLPAPEVAREAASRVRPPPQRRVPLVSCKIWSENLYHISSIEAWWLVFPRPAFCGEWWKLFWSDHFKIKSMIMRYHDKYAVCRNTMVCTWGMTSN